MWLASRKCNFPNQTLHSASDWEESSKETNNDFGWLLQKQKHPHPLVGRCLSHSAFVRAECDCEASSEQWTPKCFQACERREDSLELTNKTSPDLLPLEWGGRGGQSPKGRMHTQETIVWRKYGGTVTFLVLNHFQGIERLLLDFVMLTGVSWLTHINRHLNRSREGRKRLASGLPPRFPPLNTSPVVTRTGSRS